MKNLSEYSLTIFHARFWCEEQYNAVNARSGFVYKLKFEFIQTENGKSSRHSNQTVIKNRK